jgi:hypothetical protein
MNSYKSRPCYFPKELANALKLTITNQAQKLQGMQMKLHERLHFLFKFASKTLNERASASQDP